MNRAKRIGRYALPLGSVLGIRKRTGLRGWWKPGYDVLLPNGHKIHFTEAEKHEYDQASDRHRQVRELYGMCRGLGLRG